MVTVGMPKYIYIYIWQNTCIENINIFAGDTLAINNSLTKSWLMKWLMNSNTFNHNNIYRRIIFTY